MATRTRTFSTSIPSSTLGGFVSSASPGAKDAMLDWEYYTTYRDDTRQWREERDKLIKFTFGDQWSDGEKSNLEDRDQIDIVQNMIRPLLRTTVSLQLQGKPQGVIHGMNIGSMAPILQKFVEYHWESSSGTYLAEKVVMRQNREGVGFYIVFLDPTKDFGRGELRIGHLSYKNVFVDRAAGNRWDWGDAPRFIVSDLQRPEVFYNNNPGIKVDESLSIDNDEIRWPGLGFEGQDKIIGKPKNVSNSLGTLLNSSDGKYVRVFDVYERQLVNVHVIRQKLTQKILRIVTDDTPVTQEEKLFMVKSGDKIPQELLQQLGLSPGMADWFVLEEADAPKYRVKFHRSASGKKRIGKTLVLPISEYPIVPVVDEDTDNVEPRGEVDFQYGSQKLINAAMSLVLLNAAGSSNKKTVVDAARAGVAGKWDDFAQEWGMPNALINMSIDQQTGKFPIQQFGPDALNPAFFTLVQFFAQDLQFASSVSSLRTGDPTNAPDTFQALRTLGKWADDTLRVRRNRHELALERVFNLILEWAPFHYTFHKFFDITNDDTGKSEVFQINTPMYNEAVQSWQIMNDISSIQAQFRIRAGSTAESEALVESQLLLQLVNLNPAMARHIIKRLPVFRPSEKEEILNDLDVVAQSAQQVQQLNQALNVLRGEVARRDQSIDALSKQLSLTRFEKKVVAQDVKVQREKAKEKEKEK